MSKVNSVVLYFTIGMIPNANEVAEIARLQTVMENVRIRRGDVAADTYYSDTATRLEACDYVAGKNIPAVYTDADKGNKTVLAIPSTANPDQFKLFPAAVTIDASNADVQQLAAIKAEIDPALGLAKMTDLAAHASVTYASSDAAKATVGATGLVTAVAAGATNITGYLQTAASVTGIAAEADDDVFTKAAHGFLHGEAVDLLALGGGTGFGAINDTRYIIWLSASTFKLATTLANALAGTAINVTGDAANASMCKQRATSVCAVTVNA